MSCAALAWDSPRALELGTILDGLANAIAIVSALDISDDVKWLFGEDIATVGQQPRWLAARA
ncbi:MAG: hypothetical protein RLW68_15525 [Devosia marina]|uniref:hypothetical protein n=1 Tax=Devosia marina TaxID=2683198 RepID=UPI0032ECCBDE